MWAVGILQGGRHFLLVDDDELEPCVLALCRLAGMGRDEQRRQLEAVAAFLSGS